MASNQGSTLIPQSSSNLASNHHQESVPLSHNSMDTPAHRELYAAGLEIRKKVVGEDYVANALEKGSSDFLRPLQQYATVIPPIPISPIFYELALICEGGRGDLE